MDAVRVAVVGAGIIGRTLARAWAGAGEDVVFALRNPADPKYDELESSVGRPVGRASVEEAVRAAGVVLFAIPGAEAGSAASALGRQLDGRIVIDATNRVGAATMNSLDAFTGQAPGAHVYRAFNTLGWENFADPMFGSERADLIFCGPDGAPRTTVERLITDVGLRPVWAGGLEEAAVVDAVAALWFCLAQRRGLGRHLAFRVLTPGG